MSWETMPSANGRATAGYFGAFVAVGSATAVLGPTLLRLAEGTGSQLSQAGFLFTAMALGYLLGSLLGGRLYDRAPGHPVMAAALLVMAAMMAAAPAIPRLWLLALVVILLGIAGSMLDVGGNTLLVWVHGRRVGPYMNALHFFFGLGSTLAPIVVAQAMQRSDEIAGAYRLLALLILPAAVWLWRVPSPQAPAQRAGEPEGQPRSPASTRRLLILLVALFFLYVGAEVGFAGWIAPYAVRLGLADEATAAYLTSAFWGALTVGRLLSVPLAARVRPSRILLADLLGCLASIGVLLLWPGSAAAWLGACGLGFSMASVFPTLIALAERRLIITGRITGWFLSGSSVGGMTLPWLMGQLFEAQGPRSAMTVVGGGLLAALGVFGLLMFHSQRLPRRSVVE